MVTIGLLDRNGRVEMMGDLFAGGVLGRWSCHAIFGVCGSDYVRFSLLTGGWQVGFYGGELRASFVVA